MTHWKIIAVNCSDTELAHIRQNLVPESSLDSVDRSELSHIAPEPATAAVLIGSTDSQALVAARTAHAQLPDATLVFLGNSERQKQLHTAVQTSPFLGRAISFVEPTQDEQMQHAMRGAINRCNSTRRHRDLLGTANLQLAKPNKATQQNPHKLFLDHLLDNAPVGVVTLDDERDIVSYNRVAAELLELATSACLLDYFPPSCHSQLAHRLNTEQPTTDKQPLMLRTNPPCYVNVTASQLATNGRERLLIILQDVTGTVLAEEELKALATSLEERVQARTRDLTEAHKDLERRNSELKRSNLALDEFAYIASHDLREPLRALHNYSAILSEDLADKVNQENAFMLESLTRVTQRMENLIENLLTYSRLGRVDFAFSKTDLAPMLEELIEDLALTHNNVEFKLEGDLGQAYCDPSRLATVFRNLAANGIKYNQSDSPQIAFGKSHDETHGDFWYVQDNGIGIDAKHLERIFQVFKRLHTQNKFGGGTGVGLTFSKRIIERHGGEIWGESTPNVGSRFCFSLGATHPRLDRHEAGYESI